MSHASLVAALELIRDFPVSDVHNQDVVGLKFIAIKALKELDEDNRLEEQDDDEVMFSEEAGSSDRQRYTSYQPKDGSTFERFKAITIDTLGRQIEEKFQLTSNFYDDLGADSLDLVELVMRFEEEFELEIEDDAAEAIQTVEDAIKFANKFSNNLKG